MLAMNDSGAIAARVWTVSEMAFMSTSTPRRLAGPWTVMESGSRITWQPMRSRTSTNRTSPCAEREPRLWTRTRPPVTAASAKKYDAAEASGSTV